jgi:hypothetical protein
VRLTQRQLIQQAATRQGESAAAHRALVEQRRLDKARRQREASPEVMEKVNEILSVRREWDPYK